MTLAKIFLTPAARRRIRERRRSRPFRRLLRPTDVFLVGHPKSGNTWLAYMLAILLSKDRRNQVTLSNVGQYVPFVHGQDLRIAEYADLPSPRIFRNESPGFPELYPKIIYLVRDPRAVLVSFYHMYRVMHNDSTMTLPAFLEAYLATEGCFKEWNAGLVRWDRQVLAWTTRAKHDQRVSVVKYEELVENRQAVLQKIAHFAGIPCTDEDCVQAVGRGDFHAMQQVEEQHGAEAYPGEIGKRGRFVRRGEIDGWRDEMDDSLVQRIVHEFTPAMKACGYS